MWPFKSKPVLNKYGWNPDLPDHRDFMFKDVVAPTVALPTSVDLRKNCPPVVDQGDLGSCTANALSSAIGFLDIKDLKLFNPFSRLFIYYNERALEGTVKQDSGAQIRDGIKTLASQGVCFEVLWPYNITRFTQKPSSSCYSLAKPHKAMTYSRLITLNDMKSCLAAGFPFVFGFTVYESFESDAVAKTGIVPIPGQSESVLGGHAVMACGYDDKTQMVLVKNSWGTGWGQQGYFQLPYAYISNQNLATDMWTIRKTVSE